MHFCCACHTDVGLTCIIRPAIGQSKGVGVTPCLLVFLEPTKDKRVENVSRYPPRSPGYLLDEGCIHEGLSSLSYGLMN